MIEDMETPAPDAPEEGGGDGGEGGGDGGEGGGEEGA